MAAPTAPQQLVIPPEVEALFRGVEDVAADIDARLERARELQQYVESAKEADVALPLSGLVPQLIQVLRTGDPSFRKDAPECLFRGAILDSILRVFYVDAGRFPYVLFFSFVLHTVRNDNEDNAVAALKALCDCARMLKTVPESSLDELSPLFSEVCRNLIQSVPELFAAGRPPSDPQVLHPAVRSSRVVTEIMNMILSYLQAHRQLPTKNLMGALTVNFQLLSVEIPVQKQTRENHEAMGGIWAGMSPDITNTKEYEDMTLCLIRLAYYTTYVLKFSNEHRKAWGDQLMVNTIRILQDMPLGMIASRKDLLGVFRSSLAENRRAIIGSIDKVMDERVLVGNCLSLREAMLGMVYTALADALSHMWSDLGLAQVQRILEVYTRVMHNPTMPINAHTAAIRLFQSVVDVLPTKIQANAEIARALTTIFETVADRLEVGCVMYGDALARLPVNSEEEEGTTSAEQIEKTRPMQSPSYVFDRPDLVIQHCREFFMQALNVEVHVLQGLKKCGTPSVDGTTLSRLFRCSVVTLGYCASPPAADAAKYSAEVLERLRLVEANMEKVAGMIGTFLAEVNPHMLQEIWLLNMDFFFERVHQRGYIWSIVQYLLSREESTVIMLPIILKRLMSHLEDVGGEDEEVAGVLVRAFRGVFQAVAKFPAKNQGFLAAHLGRIVMDSFPLATKAARPSNYYHLVRALFRAMGLHINNMDALFAELVGCLPELLQTLDKQLHLADASNRDQIVELFLNIPVRLTNLLSHLHYLMRPLSIALRGTPELVSLGLRTLELCIDHLTAEFLDPILEAQLRPIHEALHALLRMQGSTPIVTTSVIRVLGKLGGRNRKLLYADPVMGYSSRIDIVTMAIPFDGRSTDVDVKPGFDLAFKMLQRPTAVAESKVAAFKYIKTTLLAIIQQNLHSPEALEDMTRALEGAFDCMYMSELQADAEALIKQITSHVFFTDARRGSTAAGGQLRRWPSPHLTTLIDTLPNALVRSRPEERDPAQAFIARVITDLVDASNDTPEEITSFLLNIATRFTSMCLGDTWSRRTGGCRGVRIMLELPMLGIDWVRDREVELIRTLLHVLKHVPSDLLDDVKHVTELLVRVLTASHAGPPADPAPPKLTHIMGVLFTELPSQSSVVRETVHKCIDVVADLVGRSPYELLLPHRERALASLYTKPLRALQYSTQIGVIEAFRYCLRTSPPLPEVNEELLRLLQETIAYATADEATLIGRVNQRQGTIDVIKLKVVCLLLLTAAIPVADYFVTRPAYQERIVTLFFRALYSSHKDIKEAARQGLILILDNKQHLPRELLTNGLKPILTHLNDTSRLTVEGLEGMAVLLGPLKSLFKVEVGTKLLDHFRFLADPQTLQGTSGTVLTENNEIKKLAGLANIFYLLPSNAGVYLEDLTNAIVNTEAYFDMFSPTPFTVPLSHFLDAYPEEGTTYFLKNLQFARHLRTARNVLQARLAQRFQSLLATRTSVIVTDFLASTEVVRVIAGLSLCTDLADVNTSWLTDHPEIVEALLVIWRHERLQPSANTLESRQKCLLVLKLLKKGLEETPRVDLLFDVVVVFSRDLPIDTIQTSRFLYDHVALRGDLQLQRNILSRFVTWIEGPAPWTDKCHFLRFVLTPMLQVHVTRFPKEGLLDSDVISCLFRCFWNPETEQKKEDMKAAGQVFLVELLHLTSVIVAHYSYLLDPYKKELVVFIWSHLGSQETIIKQCAHILAARFLDAFDAPAKFITATLTGLLKPAEGDPKKTLTEQGLEVLVKVFPRMEPDEQSHPHWATAIRRMLSEEGISAQQTTSIYSFIVRHADVFYPVRSSFAPHMVYSINRLGFFGTQNPDARLLILDIIEVLFNWEKRTMEVIESSDSMQVDGGNSSDHEPWMMSVTSRENVVSYLVRLAGTFIGDSTGPRIHFAPKALALTKQVLGAGGWTNVTVKPAYYSRPLESDMSDKESIQAASGAARVLQIVCADKDDDWYRENGPLLSNLIRKGLVLDLPLSTALLPIFERLCYLFPLRKELEDDDKMSDFHKWIRSTLSENAVIAPQPFLQMLASIGRADQESLGVLTNSILKLVQRFCKEHAEMVDDSPVTPHLITILDLIKTTIAHGGDQKKVLWLCIGYIIERCKNVAVCSHILALARHFALEHSEPFPSQKEKAALLVKFGIWEVFFPEKRPMGPNQAAVDKAKDAAGMFTKYLEVIYEIYMDPALRRSDLTSRLEGPFLVGCRARDPILREKFITLLDANIPRSLFSRLSYIIGSQGWEPLNDHNWSYVASYLLLGAVNIDATISPALISSTSPELGVSQRAESLVDSWRHMLLLDTTLGHDTWVSLFPKVWAHLSRREQVDLTHHMIALLSKDYHHRQAELRPNVIQTLLEGVHRCVPAMILPPHLIKYLAKSYGAWHVALEMLTESLDHLAEEPTGRDIVLDALAELYGELSEEDAFYGLWRRRAIHVETSIGMALEESGMWEQASAAYEHALIKAKSGSLVFTEPEYCLWEDHWILAQEKLQQWDVLYDLGRNESNNAQLLEAAWRSKNWSENREQMEQYVAALPEVATPRRCIYSAFLALLKPTPTAPGENHESSKHVNDCFRLTVHKWKTLPVRMSHAHVPLLQHFQQGIELQEAVQIFNSLATTNAQNLDKKSQDLKLVLQAWRERLPSPYDDISIWSDLVAWRRNVFNAINAVYLPLVQQTGQNGGTAGNTSTLGYRGFHETAWIINRFAHVARKHELLDACHTQLTSIYQLPNIEISEAFLKLREQARCHYLKPDELAAGLEVVNNTNLMYFSPPQKAEFFTLKGMFHSKANRLAEANEAFGQAVQTDMNQAKAWAQWGKYNDRLFKHNKTDFASGANAVSCYLQAAGLYKSGKSRPLLARVLWLLSVDDPTSAISRQFDGFKGDAVYWYWITFIPQLCLAGTYREANPARHILMNIAGLFPQALFYTLRSTRDDLASMRRSQGQPRATPVVVSTALPDGQAPPAASPVMGQASPSTAADTLNATAPPQAAPGPAQIQATPNAAGDPKLWEYVDEVAQRLKTAFPLLVLTMETVMDQFSKRFRQTPEEDQYRVFSQMTTEVLTWLQSPNGDPHEDRPVPQVVLERVARCVTNIVPGALRDEFEHDVIKSKPSSMELLRRLQHWRARYEKDLDARPKTQSLDLISHFLTEFHFGKFDDIEVPGQYTEARDTNTNFIRIQKFCPTFDNCRTSGSCYRRLTILGNDYSKTSFAVRSPGNRAWRREDRLHQMLRTFNVMLGFAKETRKRNLAFCVPATVQITPHLRLEHNSPAEVYFSDIYDQHCEEMGITREEPAIHIIEKLKQARREFKQAHGRDIDKAERDQIKVELFSEVTTKMVPDTVLTRYMNKTMNGPTELWAMRKHFTSQLAAASFMTHMFAVPQRFPSRLTVSRETGKIVVHEIIPGMAGVAPVYNAGESVPFRFTPNMQRFVGPIFTEGILTTGIMAIGRALTDPEDELEQQLCLFSRDEVYAWMNLQKQQGVGVIDGPFRQRIDENTNALVHRAEMAACTKERQEQVTAAASGAPPPGPSPVQSVTNMIALATNPFNLVKMPETWQAWF